MGSFELYTGKNMHREEYDFFSIFDIFVLRENIGSIY